MKSELPKVLVIGINAWREDATSHTLMNIFRCWNPDRLALIYSRADLPNTSVCNRYFQISESAVLKSVFKPWLKVGCKVGNTPIVSSHTIDNEHKRYANIHKHNISWLPIAREFVWKFGNWKTSALKKFVKDFDPDILFIPIYPTVYMGWIQKYIKKLTGKPTVCYLADDNYSYDSCRSLWEYIHRAWLRKQVGPLARNSDAMFVIVEKEKEDTDRRFGTNSVILTKSIDFTGKNYRYHELNQPLKFVYTGSMVIGRDKTLCLLADAINKVNVESGEIKAELYIYSQTDPCDNVRTRIDNGASHFCGCVGHDEVMRIQEDADIVVFAESLIGKQANAAKLSFSTKITDYLSNGKCIFAIGKEYIAPIDYFKRNDSAIISTTEEDIIRNVRTIISDRQLINEYSLKAYQCAIRNHEKKMIDTRFINVVKDVYEQYMTYKA